MEKYATLQQKGLATILKTENSVAISYAQFDIDSGDRVEDKVLSLDVEALKTERQSCQDRIDVIDKMLSDVDNAPLAEPVKEVLQSDIIK